MLLWFLIAVLALLVMAVLASGLWQPQPRDEASSRLAGISIYKDQLAEIDRDLQRGVLLPAEAEGQRAEIGRRLLALTREGEERARTGLRLPPRLGVALAIAVPLLALPVYLKLGAPAVPDVPHAQRLADAEKTGDMPALVARVEEHLKRKPDDAAGWQLLIPIYQNMGRFGDAAEAIARVISLKGSTAELQSDLAEMLTFQNSGMMTDAAIAAAEAGVKQDAKNPKARYYQALGLAQNGKAAEAKAAFSALLADSPADAPWRDTVTREISKLENPGSSAPQISGGQMADAANMSEADRNAMIRTMVDGLDQKLAANGKDLQGWLRLIRARSVLGEKDKAMAALSKARETLKDDSAALAALDGLQTELQLQ